MQKRNNLPWLFVRIQANLDLISAIVDDYGRRHFGFNDSGVEGALCLARHAN